MVAHGHGFSVLNQRPRHDLTYDGRRVAVRRIADDVPALRVVLATLRGVRQTARAAALADVIRDVFRETTAQVPDNRD
jgi:DNA-binding transcriptional LysR family regulator